MTTPKPEKPTPDFPLFAHRNGQWAKKVAGKIRYYGLWADPEAALLRFQGAPAKVAPTGKPAKPADFPLFPHDCGQWARKVRGKLYYFGVWADPKAALAKWVSEKDDLLAGRVRSNSSGLTIMDLCNKFLNSKQRQVESRELDQKTWQGYFDICKKVQEVLGKTTIVLDLRPEHFAKLRSAFAKGEKGEGVGPVRLGNCVTRARTLFNYAYGNDLIDRPVKYGKEFSKPKKAVLRKERKKKPKKLFSAAEINQMLGKANLQLRAMIYLGINAALANHDCALLELDHLDLDRGWLTYPRPKTGIDRRARLWPETIMAIKAVLASRPNAKHKANDYRVFITKYGTTWESKGKGWNDSPISKETRKLLNGLGIERDGVNFRSLRHTFQTVAEKSLDKDSCRYVMGHVEPTGDMSAVYSEELPSDKRLTKIAKRVRKWLFSGNKPRPQTADAGDVAKAEET